MLLITTNLRLVINSASLYEYEFNKHHVSEVTGLDKEELLGVASQIITYFNSGEEFLDVDVYNERDVAHMKDVKGLVQLVYRLQLASLAYIVVYAAVNFFLIRGAFWRGLARRLVWGSGTLIALLAFLGVWSVIDFDSLFLLFHLTSFSNDLWKLAADDNLLLMFPQGFFNDATMFIAGAAIGEAVIIGGVAWWLLVRRRKANHRNVLRHSNEEFES